MDRSDLPWLTDGARAAHKQLEATLSSLREPQVREPSLLDGWSRGHLLTHIARNADSHLRLLKATRRGELVEQYEGGQEGRAADIELGAIRDAATMVKDVIRSSIRLMTLWAALADDAWDRPVSTNLGMQPAWRLVWSRWRELAIHHVDLDLGYQPQDWPQEFVDPMLGEVVGNLASRLPAGCELTLRMTGPDDAVLAEHGITGEAQLRQNGAPSSRAAAAVAAEGPAPSLLAWLLGRPVGLLGLRFTDARGQPAPAPTLLPWL